MSCTTNYIGIKRLVDLGIDQPSTSGHYIEELPGISLSSMAQFENGKEFSGRELFTQVADRAVGLVLQDLKAFMLPYMAVEGALEEGVMGTWKTTTSEASECSTTIHSRHGKYGSLYVSGVWVKSVNTATEVPINITDGVQTLTVEADLTADVAVFVPFAFTTSLKEVTISTEEEITLYKVDTSSFNNYCQTGCCGNGQFQFLRTTGNCGFIPDVAVLCDIEAVICKYLPRLTYAILYKTGIELLKEWMSSTRLNFITIHGKEWAKETIAEWETKQYAQYMNDAIQGLPNSLQQADRYCFTCNGYRIGYTHP